MGVGVRNPTPFRWTKDANTVSSTGTSLRDERCEHTPSANLHDEHAPPHAVAIYRPTTTQHLPSYIHNAQIEMERRGPLLV